MNDPLGDDPMLAGVGQEYARVNAEQAAIQDIMAHSGPVYFSTFGMDKQAQMYMKALMNYDGRNATQAETTWLNFLSSPNSLTSIGAEEQMQTIQLQKYIEVKNNADIEYTFSYVQIVATGEIKYFHLEVLDNANQGGQPAPAWDVDHNGQLWLIEADRWYRMGNGQAITVAASSVNLKSVDPSIAKNWKKNGVYHVPLLTRNFFNDGVVFGTLDFKFLGNNQVQILPNMYDFDIGADKGHPWNREFFRNISTWLGEQVATGFGMAPGHGTPYLINFSGVATLGQGPK